MIIKVLKVALLIGLLSVVSCSKEEDHFYGYVDADLRYMASDFSGVLENLLVDRGSSVNENQLLFVLDKNPQAANLDESNAKLLESQAEISRLNKLVETAKSKLDRRIKLGPGKYTFQEEIDNAGYDYKLATTTLEEAKAKLTSNLATKASNQWAYNKKQVYSSVNGSVDDVFFRKGEFVPAGRPVLSLLAPQDIKIVFFVPERIINKVKRNQSVLVSCDGCPNPINAKVSFISSKVEFTPPVIYSDNSRTKLVFLVEALSDKETNKNLHPGQPVTVSLP